ncbi:GNAT family N-acetyltransferase [Pseudomonas sp. GV071]|jgi:RimJ/RimL family protein N-acetyltransferase|uniref:GNAT family N-acetyltransferase n=1 Tax=Pseudomonas sp. GV071 TaxID=2135754 RepID=UPI000D38C786|nr:GNAT family N-acetyltransferase [Pseudomonas sp. GV071]PTQ66918.1 RimJ/RimL family protein N-acetyltransferase [Pseudomonas sp. GV071]
MLKTTIRLLLRPPTCADLDVFHAIHADPATNQFNPAGPMTDRQHAEQVLAIWQEHWQRYGYGQWAIATHHEPETVIGFGGIAPRLYGEVERLNLGYRFAEQAWGKGYASELAAAGLAFAFDDLRKPEVFAIVRPAHAASIRVLEKVGMQRIDALDDVPGQAPSWVYRAKPQF